MNRYSAFLYLLILLVVGCCLVGGCGDHSQSTGKHDNNQNQVITQQGPLAVFSDLKGNIDIAGGTAHIPVMKRAAREIMSAHPQISITIAGGGSGVGVRKVGAGLVNIGNTGRPLSATEKQEFGLQSFPFAVDGVCAVVHPSNPVADLSSAQLQGVFSGSITNWQEVGGHDQAIHLFTRDEASGTRKVFWKIALSKSEVAPAANVVASNGAMKTAVAGDPAAIGYVSVGHLDNSIKAPDFNGIAATQQNAANGTYPVRRQLYMNTKGEPDPLTRAFIDYVQGPAGVPIIQDSGYLPLPKADKRK